MSDIGRMLALVAEYVLELSGLCELVQASGRMSGKEESRT